MKRRHMLQSLASKRRKLTKDLIKRTKTGKIAFFMFFSKKKPVGKTDRIINGKKYPKLLVTNVDNQKITKQSTIKTNSSQIGKTLKEYAQENSSAKKEIENLTSKDVFNSKLAPAQIYCNTAQRLHQVDMEILYSYHTTQMSVLQAIQEALNQYNEDKKNVEKRLKKVEEYINKQEQTKTETKTETKTKVTKISEIEALQNAISNLQETLNKLIGKEISFEKIYNLLDGEYKRLKGYNDQIHEKIGTLPSKTEISELAQSIATFKSSIITAEEAIKKSIGNILNTVGDESDLQKKLEDFCKKYIEKTTNEIKNAATTLTEDKFKEIAGYSCVKFGEYKKRDGDDDPGVLKQKIKKLEDEKKELEKTIQKYKNDKLIAESNKNILASVNTALEALKETADSISLSVNEESVKKFITVICNRVYKHLTHKIKNKQISEFKNIVKYLKNPKTKKSLFDEVKDFMDKIDSTVSTLATEQTVQTIITKLETTDFQSITTSKELIEKIHQVLVTEKKLDLLDLNNLTRYNDLTLRLTGVSQQIQQGVQYLSDTIVHGKYLTDQSLSELYIKFSDVLGKKLDFNYAALSYNLDILNNNVQYWSEEVKTQHKEITDLVKGVIYSVENVAEDVREQIYRGTRYLHTTIQSSTRMLSKEISENRKYIENITIVIQENFDYLINNYIETSQTLTEDVIRVTERSFFHYYLTVSHDISSIRSGLEKSNDDLKEYIEKAGESVHSMLKELGVYSQDLIKTLEEIAYYSYSYSYTKTVVDVTVNMPKWYYFLFPLRKKERRNYLEMNNSYIVDKTFTMTELDKIGGEMEIPAINYEKNNYLAHVRPSNAIIETKDELLSKIVADNTPHTTVVFDAVEHVAMSKFDHMLTPERIENAYFIPNPLDIKIDGNESLYNDTGVAQRLFEKNEFLRNMAKVITHYIKDIPRITKPFAEEQMIQRLQGKNVSFYSVYDGKIIQIDIGTAGQLIYDTGVIVNGVRNVFRRKHLFDKRYPNFIHQLPVAPQYTAIEAGEKSIVNLEDTAGAIMEMCFYDQKYYNDPDNVYMSYIICILACQVAFVAYRTVHHVFATLDDLEAQIEAHQITYLMQQTFITNDVNTARIMNKYTEESYLSIDVMQSMSTNGDYQSEYTVQYFKSVYTIVQKYVSSL